ncbi:MAG TPA: PSD1 and planctomycete cytochrome C domain-containing protein [Gemmataceae bacterium]|jgi:hypothetical protein|nr:PSD1 and planctomycete cytochrome C domain-containing protein [Gemmataceae bacterium]
MIFLFVWLITALSQTVTDVPAESVDYLKDVKPTLAARCYACHGGLRQKAELRVDTAKSLIDAGLVVPGKNAESPLIARVVGKVGLARMPPPSEGEPLSDRQISVLKRWIDAGAQVPADEKPDPDPRDHWAFRPPVRRSAPQSPDSQILIRNPVDAFLAAEWAKHGLRPQAPADKRLLLRRVTLDLTGLPPTPQESEAFLQDESIDAYERLVDRLLESPQYGERWGRHFLDIWRYSDWWGLGAELRNSQKHIWHWRDWVVESLNADVGYDEMIREMLAADELYPIDQAKIRATGYLARSYFLFNRTTWLDEVIEHTSKGFLGLTVNCAKCHDHKFDAIRQDDYYRLRAFFEPYQVRTDMVSGQPDFEKDGLPRAFDCNLEAPTYKHERGDERRPLTKAPLTPGLPALLTFADFKIEPIKLPFEGYCPQLQPHVVEAYRRQAEAKVTSALAGLAKAKSLVAEKSLAAAEAELASVTARVLADRLPGNQDATKAAAKAESLAALATAELALIQAEREHSAAKEAGKPAAKKKQETARAAVAKAMAALDKPSVNYTPLRGAIKAAESNLETEASRNKPFPATSTGRRSALAKWIADKGNPLTARVLVNHVWARHFGRPLVATVFDFGRKGATPSHPELLDWLACEFMDSGWSMKHLHRMIITSAAYRMSSSAKTESLASRSRSSSASIDPENRYLWRQNPVRMEAQLVRDSLLHLAGRLDLKLGGPSVPFESQDASQRRSLYFFQSHNDHNRFLSQFDDASVLECYRRSESIVPQQALALSNSKLVLQATQGIATELQGRPGNVDDKAFTIAAFQTILGYDPAEGERRACLDALAEWTAQLKAAQSSDPDGKARSNLVGALINHNDFITIR